MIRYYDPDKIECMGRCVSDVEAWENSPPPREWVMVVVLTKSEKSVAIDLSYPDAQELVLKLLEPHDNDRVRYFKIPFRYSHHFFSFGDEDEHGYP